MNVVTEAQGSPAAVLNRALDPLEGIEVMRRRRARAMKGRRKRALALAQHEICRGPGNLTMAMGITLAETVSICSAIVCTSTIAASARARIVWGPRIGIRVGTETPWVRG